MLDRYDAIVAMREWPMDQKRETLIKVYNDSKNTWHTLKGEIANQLFSDGDAKSKEVVANALGGDPWLQRDVLNSQNTIPADKLALFEALLTSKSYDNIMNALDKLCAQYPQNAQKYLDATKDVIGTSGRNVEIKRLEIMGRINNDQTSKDKLVAYTSISYEFRTRVNAAQSVKRLNYFATPLLDNLTQAMTSSNTRLAYPCGEVLDFFYSQAQLRNQIGTYVSTKTWKEWERELIGKMLH